MLHPMLCFPAMPPAASVTVDGSAVRLVISSGAERDGRSYCIYYFFTPLLTRMELGIPFKLSSPDNTVPEDSENGIIVVNRPDVEAAAMWHIGPYQRLGDTYKALCEWIRSQGKYPGSLMFEEYCTNPMEEKDPAKYRTRVYMSLSDSTMGSCSII
ncbi:unnamed protein product [Closterium sp. NIES-64]|nr:unnamed protein product [Closterium sp. NIES-64]